MDTNTFTRCMIYSRTPTKCYALLWHFLIGSENKHKLQITHDSKKPKTIWTCIYLACFQLQKSKDKKCLPNQQVDSNSLCWLHIQLFKEKEIKIELWKINQNIQAQKGIVMQLEIHSFVCESWLFTCGNFRGYLSTSKNDLHKIFNGCKSSWLINDPTTCRGQTMVKWTQKMDVGD